MNTEDLVKIKKALDKPSSYEACRAMEKLLLEMGYYLAAPNATH